MARKPAGASSAERLRRRNRELSILIAIARALNQSVDLDQALRATLAQVAELLDLRTGWIWLLDEETGESYLAAAQNLPRALAANPRHMEGRCYCLDTFRAGDLDGAANVNVDDLQPAEESGGWDRRPALPRQHPALRPRQAAGRAQRRQPRLARAVAR